MNLRQKKLVLKSIKLSKTTFSIFTKVFSFILILLILISSITLLTIKSHLFNYSIYVIESESMKPELDIGDTIIIQKMNEYFNDEIITFYPPYDDKKTFTHRVVNILHDKDTYKTRGDNNDADDPFEINLDDIEGKVIYTIPYIGNYVLFTRSIEGIIITIVIPATILITLHVTSLFSWVKNGFNSWVKRLRESVRSFREP